MICDRTLEALDVEELWSLLELTVLEGLITDI